MCIRDREKLKANTPRKDSFDITVASEVMAIFCLSNSIEELEEKIGNITVAYSKDQKPIYAKDLKAQGPMTVLLKEAVRPNVVQTSIPSSDTSFTISKTSSNLFVPERTPFQAAPIQKRVDPFSLATLALSRMSHLGINLSASTPLLYLAL